MNELVPYWDVVAPSLLHGTKPRTAVSLSHALHTQGVPYLLADPSKEVADARLWRCPLNEHTSETSRRLVLYHSIQPIVQDSAAMVVQRAWRRWARWQRSVREPAEAME